MRFRGHLFPKQYRKVSAFSLVEVVIALGLFSFCIVAILALFSVGLKTSKDSDDEMRAADLTSNLICRMRSAPETNLTSYGFPFGALTNAGGLLFNSPTNAPLYINSDGTRAANAAIAQTSRGYAVAAFGYYDATNRVATVSLTLWWPASAASTGAAGRYAISTYINTESP